MYYRVKQLSDYRDETRQQAREIWRDHQRHVLREKDTSVYVYTRLYSADEWRIEHSYGETISLDEYRANVKEDWENGRLVERRGVTVPITALTSQGVGDWDAVGDYTYDEETNLYYQDEDEDRYTLDECLDAKLEELEEEHGVDEALAHICAALVALEAYAAKKEMV